MDVDVVLNACLETYQQDELQKVQEAARIKRQQQEAITSSMSSKLFNMDGISIANVTELSISQSQNLHSVREIGTARSFSVPGRTQVTGTFYVDYNEELYRRMNSNLFEYSRTSRPLYILESEVLFSNGASESINIHDVDIVEEPTTRPGKVFYRFMASRLNPIKTVRKLA